MQNKSLRILIALLVLLAILIYVFWDRYPTATDCDEVADGYLDRGYFDATTAAAYRADCRQAASREERQVVVDRMNDEASIRASRP